MDLALSFVDLGMLLGFSNVYMVSKVWLEIYKLTCIFNYTMDLVSRFTPFLNIPIFFNSKKVYLLLIMVRAF